MKEYTSKKRCPNCNGEPFKSTSPCTMCSGEGWIEIEGLRTDPYQQESATTSRACPANCPGNITRPTSQEAERMVDEIIGLAQSAEGHAHWGETKGSDECLKMMNEKKSRLLALCAGRELVKALIEKWYYLSNSVTDDRARDAYANCAEELEAALPKEDR